MLPGDDIYEQVDRGIKLWDKVLLCCSRHSLTSWWVDTAFEKERRLMRERGKRTLALVPLNLDGYIFKDQWASGKAQQVRPTNSEAELSVLGYLLQGGAWRDDVTAYDFAAEREQIIWARHERNSWHLHREIAYLERS
jgi:hypothetical protein